MACPSKPYRSDQPRIYGRFRPAHSPLELFVIVREAVEQLCAGDPEQLSQALFDRSRVLIGHPDAPTAKQTSVRLRLPWRELRRLAADPERNLLRLAQQVDREQEADYLNERHVFFALALVGLRRVQTTLTLDEYDLDRAELIAEDDRRWRFGGLLEELMPSGNQLIRIAGGREAALKIGRFEVRAPESSSPGSVPIVDALDYHMQETGYTCGYRQLDRFARAHGFSLASREPGRPWGAYLDELAVRCAARGVDVPPYPPPGTRLEYATTPFPGLPPRRRREYWTREKALDALEQYLEQIEREAAQPKPSQRDYLAHQKGNPNWPPPSTLQRFGRFHELLATARERRRARRAADPGQAAQ